MKLSEFKRQARELEHTISHHRRTIVCNPAEAEAIQQAVDSLVNEPQFAGANLPVPVVTANPEVKVGQAYIACYPCLASRLNDSAVQ